VVAGPDPLPRPEACTGDGRGANGSSVAGVISWLVARCRWVPHYPGSERKVPNCCVRGDGPFLGGVALPVKEPEQHRTAHLPEREASRGDYYQVSLPPSPC
jgi:hypothetical protein